MFELDTEDQAEIRRTAHKFASERIPHFFEEQYRNTVPRELFRGFAEIGFAGMAVPDAFGGTELDPASLALVLEEIARADVGSAVFLSVHTMVSGLISTYGTESQQRSLLPRLAAGEWLGAFALSEAGAGSDAAALSTTAKRTDEGYILNGEKSWITSAGFADLYIVFARTAPGPGNSGISAFVVPSSTDGVVAGKPEHKMGCELSPIAPLSFQDARLPKEALLGREGEGYRIALSALAKGRVSIAACACGVARAALERAVRHLKERKQFGTHLIEMQGLQFMLAEMNIQLEAARTITWRAARLLGENGAGTSGRSLPSIAKCFATDAAMRITTDAVQLMGASGYVREYEVERYMRDAKALQIVEGTNQIQRLIIARAL